MAVAQLNLSRRALLGAAFAAPVLRAVEGPVLAALPAALADGEGQGPASPPAEPSKAVTLWGRAKARSGKPIPNSPPSPEGRTTTSTTAPPPATIAPSSASSAPRPPTRPRSPTRSTSSSPTKPGNSALATPASQPSSSTRTVLPARERARRPPAAGSGAADYDPMRLSIACFSDAFSCSSACCICSTAEARSASVLSR